MPVTVRVALRVASPDMVVVHRTLSVQLESPANEMPLHPSDVTGKKAASAPLTEVCSVPLGEPPLLATANDLFGETPPGTRVPKSWLVGRIDREAGVGGMGVGVGTAGCFRLHFFFAAPAPCFLHFFLAA